MGDDYPLTMQDDRRNPTRKDTMKTRVFVLVLFVVMLASLAGAGAAAAGWTWDEKPDTADAAQVTF